MLDPIDPTTISHLIEWDRPPCVSIHVPMERAGRETRQNRIRMKNAVDRASEMLDRHPGAAALTDIGEILAPARELIDDGLWWQHQEAALTVVAAPGLFARYRYAIDVSERVLVADRFHVKPLIRSRSESASFAVVAISRNRVRLFTGDRDDIAEITLPETVPSSLDDALWYLDQEKQLQHHVTSSQGSEAMFHGHGTPDDKDERRLADYLRAVANGIRVVIDGELIVLAGVEEVTARFRRVANGLRIADASVTGNADRLATNEIHGRAWDIAAGVLDEVREHDAERIAAGMGTTDLIEVLEAATMGRIDALFVARERAVWGHVCPAVEIHDEYHVGDRDLLDAAVTETWARNGRVHVVASEHVPGDGVAGASFRY